MSLFSAAGVAISSNYCGGMAMDYVCLRSVWSADGSSGRKRKAAPFRSVRRSYRCCWKALTGAAHTYSYSGTVGIETTTEHVGKVFQHCDLCCPSGGAFSGPWRRHNECYRISTHSIPMD